MECKTRAEQNRHFTKMRLEFEYWLFEKGWPWRQAEAARTMEYAEILAKDGKGKLDTLHRYSLADDYWLTTDNGLDIKWIDSRYQEMGEKWESLGGWWGGRRKKKLRNGKVVSDPDVYHFDLGQKPLKY